jgi:calcineurin-like phosphoesterase family protein
MSYFLTSDWHLNETRIGPDFNPFFRPFKSIQEQNETIINNCNAMVGKKDTLIHVGDVSIDAEGVNLLSQINCKNKILIIGNYDEDKLDLLKPHFKEIHETLDIKINKVKYHINHYPNKALPNVMNIVGHIHGLWKVQPNMINVGVDAWNYEPLDEKRIQFVTNAIAKYYDNNVFPHL